MKKFAKEKMKEEAWDITKQSLIGIIVGVVVMLIGGMIGGGNGNES